MFDEVVLRLNLGCKLSAGQLVVVRSSQNQSSSIVAVSQTLDKLVVHETRAGNFALGVANEGEQPSGGAGSISVHDELPVALDHRSVYFIAIRDIIKSISTRSINLRNVSPFAHEIGSGGAKLTPANASLSSVVWAALDGSRREKAALGSDGVASKSIVSKDLIIIGCSNSVLIYDATDKSKSLFSINTSTSVCAITGTSNCWPAQTKRDITDERSGGQSQVAIRSATVCGGQDRIFSIRFERSFDGMSEIEAEISSERSTGVTTTCLVQGNLDGVDLALGGSYERTICAYQLDLFEQNIQASKTLVEESSQINCLCPIYTSAAVGQSSGNEESAINVAAASQVLPSVASANGADQVKIGPSGEGKKSSWVDREQMNYFAYGLEANIIGVYRLFYQLSGKQQSVGVETLASERVWRHKCRYTPMTMVMYDLNGDGLDELVIGFRNGRIEARSPFTGQLLATTRFVKSADRLAGLTVIDYHQDGNMILLACSTSGSMIGFRPRLSRPRRPLQGYLAAGHHYQSAAAAAAAAGNQMLMSELAEQRSWISGSSVAGNLKTIAEENQSRLDHASVLMRETAPASASDLHIESESDDTKPVRSDAKQSHELLQRVNCLQAEQMELERKACRIQQTNVYQASEFYARDISIAHRWDFDSTTASLKLTIVIGTHKEIIRLVQLVDESRNLLRSGYMLANVPKSGAINAELQPGTGDEVSHVIVVPLRAERFVKTRLELRVFCESPQAKGKSAIRAARVYTKLVDVPKFAMLTFPPENSELPNDAPGKKMKLVKQLKDSWKIIDILDWLGENFLCFQFGILIRNHSGRLGDANIIGHPNLIMRDRENFKLTLLDLASRQQGEQVRESSGDSMACKFLNSSSTLLQIELENGSLSFECDSSDLAVDLIRSFMIDRLHLKPKISGQSQVEEEPSGSVSNFEPILDELQMVTENSNQLEESERRIQSELYESADYVKNLMQQFEIANELNEFTTGKELLNELSIMLAGTQNSALAHCLNNRARLALSRRANKLREKLSFLSAYLD